MQRIFYHYTLWEDFHHGMYDEDKNGRESRVIKAAGVLGDPPVCECAMNMVVKAWPVATAVNLSNAEINRRAWLGQAACSIYADVHEDETREAWGLLTNEQRKTANDIATRIIKKWLQNNDTDIMEQFNLFDDGGDMF